MTGLKSLVSEAITSGETAEQMSPALTNLRLKGRLADEDAKKSLLFSADKACMSLAHERPASDEEFARVADIFTAIEPDFLNLEKRIFVKSHGYISLSFSNTLYQVLHGQLPYFDPSTPISFRLSRDEEPIIKRGATLAEYRTVSSGNGHHSISLPIGNGIYYRVGASAPRSEQTGLLQIDQGEWLITTKALYFGGAKETFKISMDSILRLESFVDGVGVYENFGTGKVFIPYSLGFDDGWFFYNLISALSAQAA